MQLNISTDYAIRALLYLTICDRQASSSEISAEMSIPDNYLYAVMGKLKKAGLAVATRGVNGGWSLAKPAKDITLLDVIEVMEGTIRINRCLQDDHYCSRDGVHNACPVHSYYSEMQDHLEKCFSAVTLVDLKDRSWTPVAALDYQK